ncbi:hypothetical protein [uncultured Muribaculum sp.]|uniref:hypothetical protein n=2 Tax=uncultured Muribaculum sp. TaxID=1918613 RepID=UPI0025B08578|nr:hypothetical protein [uncultured Muribaculum sp.]
MAYIALFRKIRNASALLSTSCIVPTTNPKRRKIMNKIKTVGDLRKVIADLSDDFEIEMRIRRKLSDEEIKGLAEKYGRIYPYPYETEYATLEFDDIGHSDRMLCLGVERKDD